MKAKTTTTALAVAQKAADKKATQQKTLDLPDVVRQVFQDLDGTVPQDVIMRVALANQAAIGALLGRGFRVSLHNFLTLHTSGTEARQMTCPLDGKQYELPAAVRVNVRVGAGLKRAVQKAAPKAKSAPGDKKRPDSQRKGANQAGAKPRAKRADSATPAATTEEAAG